MTQRCLPKRKKNLYHIVIIDDSLLQCRLWASLLWERYGEKVFVEYFTDPRVAVRVVSADVSFVLVDLQMPHMDGCAVLEALSQRGIDRHKMVILSARAIETLHELFGSDDCLAVLQKGEPHQHEALLLILDELTETHVQGSSNLNESPWLYPEHAVVPIHLA